MGEEILTTSAGAEHRAVDQPVAWSARGNPAQMALLECSVFEVFFGGARGGGKTDGKPSEFHSEVTRERIRAGVIIDRFQKHFMGELDLTATHARLRFAYLERDADADQYQ